jgi:hypothetical protein
MEEKILKIPHILDQIIHHLKNDDDYINLLTALKVGKVYTLRQLKISQNPNIASVSPTYFGVGSRWRLNRLLKFFLPFFNSNEIRSRFDIIWDHTTFLSDFNEKFFIENYDLIDHKKLLEMKCEFGVDSNFSKVFHDRFPTFSSLKVCSNFLDCETEITDLAIDQDGSSSDHLKDQMCSNCRVNKCRRCGYVMLPKLIYTHDRYCDGCLGCPQYSDYF